MRYTPNHAPAPLYRHPRRPFILAVLVIATAVLLALIAPALAKADTRTTTVRGVTVTRTLPVPPRPITTTATRCVKPRPVVLSSGATRGPVSSTTQRCRPVRGGLR